MSPDRATVLFDLHLAADALAPNAPPTPAMVAAWCIRFPKHARSIRAHVATWRWLAARGRR